jgi:hypothetical protein
MSDNAPAMLEEGTDYRLLPYSDDVWSVLILEGRYKDTIMLYGNVSVQENPDDEEAGEINFEIELVESTDELSAEDPDFQKYCGDMLVSILSKAFETGEYEIGERESGDEGSTEPTD